MNKQRRVFLNQLSLMAGLAALNKPLTSIASVSKQIYSLHNAGNRVTIYHTNDLHGKLDAVHHNMGGLYHIKSLLLKQETSGLLLDAGDFLDGAPGLSRHQNVVSLMNKMGYHAAAIGNNELALGQDYLASLAAMMKFNLVNCNYGFDGSLSKFVKPYIVVNSGNFKIGITGVGHQLNGVGYTDPIKAANFTAAVLKEKEKCDLVICLSHLGFSQENDKPDNQKLAKQSENIDLVVGGHNQTLLGGPVIKLNKHKQEVIISQAAWDGLMMGKLVFGFEKDKYKSNFNAKILIAGQPDGYTFKASLAELRLIEKRSVSA